MSGNLYQFPVKEEGIEDRFVNKKNEEYIFKQIAKYDELRLEIYTMILSYELPDYSDKKVSFAGYNTSYTMEKDSLAILKGIHSSLDNISNCLTASFNMVDILDLLRKYEPVYDELKEKIDELDITLREDNISGLQVTRIMIPLFVLTSKVKKLENEAAKIDSFLKQKNKVVYSKNPIKRLVKKLTNKNS